MNLELLKLDVLVITLCVWDFKWKVLIINIWKRILTFVCSPLSLLAEFMVQINWVGTVKYFVTKFSVIFVLSFLETAVWTIN